VQKFPTRTLVLMVLALLAFAWMWWQTQHLRQTPAPAAGPHALDVEILPAQGGDR
jgi:hypothetical protein